MSPEVKKPPLSTERKNAGAKQGELTKIARVGIVYLTKLANTHGDLTSPRGSSANEKNTPATILVRLNHGHSARECGLILALKVLRCRPTL